MNRRLFAVCLDYAARATASLVFALPLVAMISGTGIDRFPEGDRLLFEPGALLASEVARLLLPALGTTLSASLTTFVVLSALLVVPHAAVLSALAGTGELDARSVWGRALGSVPALLLVTGVTLLAQVFVLVLAGTAASFVRGSFALGSPRLADSAFLVVLAVGCLVALLLGAARDVARAGAVQRGSDGRTALLAAASVLRPAGATLARVFALRVVGAILLVGAASVACGLLDVSRPGTPRLALVAFLHQAAALGIAAIRVSWFDATLTPFRDRPAVAAAPSGG